MSSLTKVATVVCLVVALALVIASTITGSTTMAVQACFAMLATMWVSRE